MKRCHGPCHGGRFQCPCPQVCKAPEKNTTNTALALIQYALVAITFTAAAGVIAGVIHFI